MMMITTESHTLPILRPTSFLPSWAPGPSFWLIMIIIMMIFWWIMMMITKGSQTLSIAPPFSPLLSPSLLCTSWKERVLTRQSKNSQSQDQRIRSWKIVLHQQVASRIKLYFELGESWSTRRGVVVTLGGYKTILDHYYEHMVSSRGLIAFCSCLWPTA